MTDFRTNSASLRGVVFPAVTAAAYLFIAVVLLTSGDDREFTTWVGNLGQLAFAGTAAAFCGLATRRSTGRMRLAWAALTIGASSWTIGQTVWCGYELIADVSTPFPSVADLGFLTFALAGMVGLWLFPTIGGGVAGLRAMLDGLLVVTSILIISWATTLGPVFRAGGESDLGFVVSLAYPITDILLVSVAVITLSRDNVHRVSHALLAAAMTAMAVADSGFAYLNASGGYHTGSPMDLGWLTAFLLLAYAARRHGRRLEHPARLPREHRFDRPASASMLPYLPLLVAGAVVGGRYLNDYRPGQLEVIALSVAVMTVLARQYLTVRDNRRLLDIVAAREQQLQRQAFSDQLTGLANRALFADRVTHALELHRRDLRPLALMFCDLDDFKAVNDTMGHAAGDALLVRVSERLRGALRAGDTLARLGGDEFAILIEDGGEAAAVGMRIIEALRSPFIIDDTPLVMRASVGLIEVAGGDPSPPLDALLARADIAMYSAKRAGKGRLALYDPTMVLPEARDLKLREPLSRAIDRGEIGVAYQPVVSLVDGTVAELEALARWQFEDSDVPPGEFIPVAVRAGLIQSLTDHVLNRACLDLADWSRTLGRTDLRVSVNIPPSLIVDRQFPDRLAALLGRHGLQPAQLVLEITEDALLSDLTMAKVVTSRLADLGVHVALDDFGSGNSSLVHLQEIFLDGLKIDIALIADIDRAARTERFLRALLALGRDLDLVVTAEGVERPEQAEVLLRNGCTFAQGYLFAEPMAADRVAGFVRDRVPAAEADA